MKKLLLIVFAICAITAHAHEGCEDTTHKQQVEKTSSTAEEKPFVYVEQMPQYPGGDVEMRKFIAKNLKYPESAQKNGIEGRVVIRFVVSKTGKTENVEVIRSLDPDCDKEAVRVISSMNDWRPGKHMGETVSVYFAVPITFTLGEEYKTKEIK